MKNILLISIATIKGGIRDKTLFGLSILALFLLLFILLLDAAGSDYCHTSVQHLSC
ncbi:MAG: hypothetical protein KKC21_07220 [Nitrospinae bacterium]|nr:hypothetical protein [Nitrospinota bacterium]